MILFHLIERAFESLDIALSVAHLTDVTSISEKISATIHVAQWSLDVDSQICQRGSFFKVLEPLLSHMYGARKFFRDTSYISQMCDRKGYASLERTFNHVNACHGC